MERLLLQRLVTCHARAEEQTEDYDDGANTAMGVDGLSSLLEFINDKTICSLPVPACPPTRIRLDRPRERALAVGVGAATKSQRVGLTEKR